MYLLTNECGHSVWTRHGRFDETYEELEEDIVIYRTHDDAHEAALEIARDHEILLRIVELETFMADKRKDKEAYLKRCEERSRHVQYLPFECAFKCKETGEIAGRTLTLIVDQGDLIGLIVQMKEGDVLSFIDEEYEYGFDDSFTLVASSLHGPTWPPALSTN